jgi:hypothetical protein
MRDLANRPLRALLGHVIGDMWYKGEVPPDAGRVLAII